MRRSFHHSSVGIRICPALNHIPWNEGRSKRIFASHFLFSLCSIHSFRYPGHCHAIQAYTGDALVAVLAGKMASLAASARGISGPFDLSIVFLAAGGIVAGAFWKENRASSSVSSATASAKEPEGGIKVAFDIVMKDKRLILLGAVQSLFEAAMYVFILQW